jgi:hypothetical protein
LGGAVGITLSGYGYFFYGWYGVAGLAITTIFIPFAVGVSELVNEKKIGES